MTLSEHDTLKAFEEVIKKESGYFKSLFHRLLYGFAPLFLLAGCLLSLFTLIVAYRISIGYTSDGGSLRSTIVNVAVLG